jgi:hypothetical protein
LTVLGVGGTQYLDRGRASRHSGSVPTAATASCETTAGLP